MLVLTKGAAVFQQAQAGTKPFPTIREAYQGMLVLVSVSW